MGQIKVMETNNYRLFELLPLNRDVVKTKVLMESMRKYGWINSKPVSVIQNGNGKLKIKDGHHRFEVAQRLGIPIKYVIDKDDSTIYELDSSTNKWSMLDCLTSYCRAGKIEYLKVKAYCDETQISLGNAVTMLGGQTAGTGNFYSGFREGRFKVRENCNHASVVKDLVLCCKNNGVKFYNHNLLTQAFSKIAWADQFDLSHMKSKIKNFTFLFQKKANLDQYLTMLEEIYNWKSRSTIPLKYFAIEKAKERSVSHGITA
jgi:hypothetical protein